MLAGLGICSELMEHLAGRFSDRVKMSAAAAAGGGDEGGWIGGDRDDAARFHRVSDQVEKDRGRRRTVIAFTTCSLAGTEITRLGRRWGRRRGPVARQRTPLLTDGGRLQVFGFGASLLLFC